MKSFSYGENFFPSHNGSNKPISRINFKVLESLKNYRSPNPRQIEISLDGHPQLTPTNDYPINCSHSTGSPHTTKITREKIKDYRAEN
jgi:hypothetical protein